MTDRTVFGGRKFYTMYLQSQFTCYEMYPLASRTIRQQGRIVSLRTNFNVSFVRSYIFLVWLITSRIFWS
jgi:hypothetical protein